MRLVIERQPCARVVSQYTFSFLMGTAFLSWFLPTCFHGSILMESVTLKRQCDIHTELLTTFSLLLSTVGYHCVIIFSELLTKYCFSDYLFVCTLEIHMRN